MALLVHQNNRHSAFQPLAIGFAIFAVISGFVASLGSSQMALVIAVLFLGLFLLAAPLALLWAVLLGGLVLSGVAELHFPAFAQARWGVAVAAMALGAISLLQGAWGKRTAYLKVPKVWSPIATWAVLFFSVVIVSSATNQGLSFDAIVGFKGYFQVWGILLAFALLALQPCAVDRIMMGIIWLGLLQLPFILHQHFFLVPLRSGVADAARGVVAQDILVGTFSGSMSGGGAGTAMAVLLLLAICMALAMWRCGKLSSLRTAVYVLVFFIPLALGEHKIALVLIPVGLFVVFDDIVRRDPLKAVGLGIAVATFLVALFVAYTLLPRTGSSKSLTPDQYWDEMWSYNVGDRGYGNAALNRSTVYPFWLKHHQDNGGALINTLIGNGPGASKDAQGGLAVNTLAALRYPGFGIGLTGLVGLLWDVGLLGTSAVIGLFVSAYVSVVRLIRRTTMASPVWVHLKAAQAGIIMIGFCFLHNNMFVYEIGFQTLVMLLLGYVIYAQRVAAGLPGKTV